MTWVRLQLIPRLRCHLHLLFTRNLSKMILLWYNYYKDFSSITLMIFLILLMSFPFGFYRLLWPMVLWPKFKRNGPLNIMHWKRIIGFAWKIPLKQPIIWLESLIETGISFILTFSSFYAFLHNFISLLSLLFQPLLINF